MFHCVGLNAVYNALNPKQNIRRLIDEGLFTQLDLALLFTGRQEPTTTPKPGISNYLSDGEPGWAKAMRFQEFQEGRRKRLLSGTKKNMNQKFKKRPFEEKSMESSLQKPSTDMPITATTLKQETTTKSLCQLLSESKFRLYLGKNGGEVVTDKNRFASYCSVDGSC